MDTHATSTKPTASQPEQRLAGLRVLAVDDVDFNRMILDDLLVTEHAQVVMAEDGPQALALVEASGGRAFDVVLMDLEMPQMNGYEATERLRELAPHLPVIGLTAHAMSDVRDKCLSAGMVANVSKPVNADDLVTAIRRHVRWEPAAGATPSGQERKLHKLEASAGSSPLGQALPPRTSGLIDWDAVADEYQLEVSDLEEFAECAHRSLENALTKLHKAVEAEDIDALAFIAHGVCSTAGHLKVDEVQALATRTDRSARARQPDAWSLARQFVAVLEPLVQELNDRGSAPIWAADSTSGTARDRSIDQVAMPVGPDGRANRHANASRNDINHLDRRHNESRLHDSAVTDYRR